jgi:small GTP-binding protein
LKIKNNNKMADDPNSKKSLKIILLGESGVGKTNLINVLLGKPFEENSYSSLSSSYSTGTFVHGDKKYPYVLWDTAGQESYRSLNKIFMKNSNVVLFVYSIDNMKSFTELGYWIECAKNEVDEKCVMAIAGNKSDLIYQQKVPDEEADDYAKKMGMKLKFTSALIDQGGFKAFIEELILDYISGNYKKEKRELIKENNDIEQKDKTNPIELEQKKPKKKKFC